MARTTLVIAAVCVTLLSAEVAHAQRFTDNNDGTVTDHQTGLMWEKKTPAGSGPNGRGRVHNVDLKFTWCNGPYEYGVVNRCILESSDVLSNIMQAFLGNLANGSIFTVFLAILNHGNTDAKGCFANHCDWRLPSDRELETIYDTNKAEYCRTNRYCGADACIDPIFGPTQADVYISISADGESPDSSLSAYGVDFGGCSRGNGLQKTRPSYVRAVRYNVKSLVQ